MPAHPGVLREGCRQQAQRVWRNCRTCVFFGARVCYNRYPWVPVPASICHARSSVPRARLALNLFAAENALMFIAFIVVRHVPLVRVRAPWRRRLYRAGVMSAFMRGVHTRRMLGTVPFRGADNEFARFGVATERMASRNVALLSTDRNPTRGITAPQIERESSVIKRRAIRDAVRSTPVLHAAPTAVSPNSPSLPAHSGSGTYGCSLYEEELRSAKRDVRSLFHVV